MLNELPYEVFLLISEFLDFKSVFVLESSCKSWRNLSVSTRILRSKCGENCYSERKDMIVRGVIDKLTRTTLRGFPQGGLWSHWIPTVQILRECLRITLRCEGYPFYEDHHLMMEFVRFDNRDAVKLAVTIDDTGVPLVGYVENAGSTSRIHPYFRLDNVTATASMNARRTAAAVNYRMVICNCIIHCLKYIRTH
jgi:hypothetical protein